MMHSPRRTRSQASAVNEQSGSLATATEAEPRITQVEENELLRATLQATVEELRILRQERQLMSLRGQGEPGEQRDLSGQSNQILKLKTDVYDGETSLREYISQFELVARASGWADREKAYVLAANLRGKARSVLKGLEGEFSFQEIKAKLEFRFGERCCFQNYYSQFTNRKLRFGEEFASFGLDLEKLVRLAYPECNFEVRDKIACAQFVAGLPEGNIKQTLQLEGVISLRTKNHLRTILRIKISDRKRKQILDLIRRGRILEIMGENFGIKNVGSVVVGSISVRSVPFYLISAQNRCCRMVWGRFGGRKKNPVL